MTSKDSNTGTEGARGIPSLTYVRILPGRNNSVNDISVDGNSVVLNDFSSQQPATRHEVAEVLDRSLSEEDVCEHIIGNKAGSGIGAALNPITAFINDAATATIFIIGSKESRKWKFLKKTFLPFLANELFSTLQEREQQCALLYGSADFYSTTIKVSAFEIQDEIISDLIKPENRGLAVSMTTDDGVGIRGISKEIVTNEMAMRKILFESCENRVSHSQPVGGTIDTSAALWQIDLVQREMDNQGNMNVCISKLLVVDIPSIDALVSTPDGASAGANGGPKLRQLQGMSLYKSLITFIDVVKKLSTPSKSNFAPFRSSKLTHSLSELLGGNSIVVGLGIICSGESQVSRRTLDVIKYLSSTSHFPVSGREITDILQGLLSKYRALILQLQDELLNGPVGEEDSQVSEKRVYELQREMAKLMLDKSVAEEDRNKVFEMMELLKAKYQATLNEKISINQELIKSEEEKMSMARILIELKLEHSQLLESTEKEKYDLSREILECKAKIAELESSLESLTNTADSLKTSNSQLESELRDEKSSHNTTRATLTEVKAQLDRESDRSIELGAEVLTLVNQREVLTRKNDELQNIVDAANIKLTGLGSAKDRTDETMRGYRSDLEAKEEELRSCRLVTAEADLEIKRLRMELDHSKQDAERLVTDFSREKENLVREFNRERQAMEDSLAAGSVSSNSTSSSNTSGSALELQAKKLDKRVKELQKALERSSEDLKDANAEKKRIDAELLALRTVYRRSLATVITGDEADAQRILMPSIQQQHTGLGLASSFNFNNNVLSSSDDSSKVLPSNVPKTSRGSSASIVPRTARAVLPSQPQSPSHSPISMSISMPEAGRQGSSIIGNNDIISAAPVSSLKEEDVLKDLIGSYVDRERRLAQAYDAVSGNCHQLRQAIRLLFDKYQDCVDVVDEQLTSAAAINLKKDVQYGSLVSEQPLIATAAIQEAQTIVDITEKNERELLRGMLHSAQSDTIAEQERLTLIISSYKRNLEKTEAKLAQTKQENVGLNIQIKQLVDNIASRTSSSIGASSNTSVGVNPNKHVQIKGGDEQAFMTKAEYKDQLKDMQNQLAAQMKELLRGPATTVITNPTTAIETDSKKPSLITGAASSRKPSNPSKADNNNNIIIKGEEMNIQEARNYISQLEGNASSAVVAKLREAEQKVAMLANQNTSLQEELQNYQTYMRTAVLQFKKQILSLQQQLQQRQAVSLQSQLQLPEIAINNNNITKAIGDIDSKNGNTSNSNVKFPIISK